MPLCWYSFFLFERCVVFACRLSYGLLSFLSFRFSLYHGERGTSTSLPAERFIDSNLENLSCWAPPPAQGYQKNRFENETWGFEQALEKSSCQAPLVIPYDLNNVRPTLNGFEHVQSTRSRAIDRTCENEAWWRTKISASNLLFALFCVIVPLYSLLSSLSIHSAYTSVSV